MANNVFNKNHFNLIGDVLTKARRDEHGNRKPDDVQAVIDDVAFLFADELQGTNDSYSPKRFLFGCNVRKDEVRGHFRDDDQEDI